MKQPLTLLLTVITAILISGCSQKPKKPDTKNADKDRSASLEFIRPVAFLSADGDTLSTLKAAIADTDKERSQGLMDVRNLPANKGMLFIFKENRPRGFWMANTPLPLDIIFVNTEKQIVRIHRNAQPFSEETLTSEKPAQYVIETNAGYTVTHDIREGMSVAF